MKQILENFKISSAKKKLQKNRSRLVVGQYINIVVFVFENIEIYKAIITLVNTEGFEVEYHNGRIEVTQWFNNNYKQAKNKIENYHVWAQQTSQVFD